GCRHVCLCSCRRNPEKRRNHYCYCRTGCAGECLGPAPTIAAKRTATATKTDTPIEKTPQSISVVTREEMDMKQPGTVKQALAYTPSVFATRGASTTYDVVSIRGFTTSSTVNTNQYLDGMKLQGDN